MHTYTPLYALVVHPVITAFLCLSLYCSKSQLRTRTNEQRLHSVHTSASIFCTSFINFLFYFFVYFRTKFASRPHQKRTQSCTSYAQYSSFFGRYDVTTWSQLTHV